MNIILKARNLNKSFVKSKTQRLHILKDIDFEVGENRITEIVGASGAGKSTLLHVLSGLDRPDSGEVIIKGTNIGRLNDEKMSAFRNRHIGFVFQFHHLLPEFTSVENVALAIMIDGTSLKEAKSKASDLLQKVGLEERLDHKPAELSGGEQQRVAVARALANDPSIIFADEPTGNLDSKNSEMLHLLFRKLCDEYNTTFLIVTHNPDLMKLADKVYEMKDGSISELNG